MTFHYQVDKSEWITITVNFFENLEEASGIPMKLFELDHGIIGIDKDRNVLFLDSGDHYIYIDDSPAIINAYNLHEIGIMTTEQYTRVHEYQQECYQKQERQRRLEMFNHLKAEFEPEKEG